jgi:hypothetical protein
MCGFGAHSHVVQRDVVGCSYRHHEIVLQEDLFTLHMTYGYIVMTRPGRNVPNTDVARTITSDEDRRSRIAAGNSGIVAFEMFVRTVLDMRCLKA